MIPEDLTAGIVQILSYDGIVAGTGFLVTKNMIATCAHVIESTDPGPDNKVTVRFPLNGKELNAIIIPERWRSPNSEDLSILQLEDNIPEDAKVLSLSSSSGVIGHKVCAFGFPDVGEIEGIWSRGEVSGKVIERGISLLQINSNEITEGFSGAPLWDESRHRVIGIVVSIAVTDSHGKLQNIAFAIPSETLISICPELKTKDICPYRGLFSFKEDDEYLFFGRTKIVLKLADHLRINPRFLSLVGSSGSGKSSLVFAGLLPLIKRGEIVGFENAQIVTFRPNDVSRSNSACDSDPVESLRQSMEKSGIHIEKDELWEGTGSYLEKNPAIRLVIYADQFETLFSNCNETRQAEFLQGIQGLLKRNLKVSFLLTVRGDYYDYLLNSLLGEYLGEGQINVKSMSEDEMREAIKKPANVTGLEVETGLEDIIINDLKNTKNPLPLLEFTITKLWESRSNGMLTHDGYIKIGGASGAIGQWANETYNSLNAEEKEIARKIFTRLVHYGKGDLPDSRRRLLLESLTGENDKTAVHRVIKKLADAHILVTDCDLSGKNETVEIIHDSLLIEWKQLGKWISEHRGFLTWRQRLEDKIEEWNRKDDTGNLLRGGPLVEAKDWMKRYKEEFNIDEIKYIKASSELEEKERIEKERARSRIIKGLTIVSVIFLILAGFAAYQWYQTEQQKQQAFVLSLNGQSVILQQNKETLDKGILLAIESFQILRTPTADQLIRQGLLLMPDNVVVLKHDEGVNDIVFSPDGKYVATASTDKTAGIWDAYTGEKITVLNHNGKVNDIVFSPDGKYVATASTDNVAGVWDVSTGKEITILKHDNVVNSIVYSPDGKYVATASDDNTAGVWNAYTGEKITVLKHKDSVYEVAFSPDGKYIATASDDNTAGVWNAYTGEKITVLKHNDSVYKVAFSPNGKYIATASDDNTAGIWDAYTGEKITVLNHNGKVNDVIFSPDGKYVLTAGGDNKACLWNADTGEKKFDLNQDYSVYKVKFSPDGKYVASAGGDNTACLWDTYTGKEIEVMNHGHVVYDVEFSPDGKFIATASEDKTACVWNVSTKITVLNHNDSVNKVRFSPDGKYVATASEDKTACVWDTDTGKEIAILKHDGGVNDVTFSPDGKCIATASDDKTTRLWNATTGKEITVLKHNGMVKDIEFSPDDKYLATADDKTAHLWDATTGKEIAILKHDGMINDVVFSPDGKCIATASDDNTTRLWDATTGKEITILKLDGTINDVVFSPDGKYIASASSDRTACVWDVTTGKEIAILKHDNNAVSVAFSPDGKEIATASWDNTARLWDVDTGKEIATLKHDFPMDKVLFSPDGKYVATINYVNTAHLWDADTGENIAILKHSGGINDIAFSPNGKYAATASSDNTGKLWLCSTEDLIKESINCFTRNLTPEEWKLYVGNEPYRKTFPNLP